MNSPLSPSEAIRRACLDAGACAAGFATVCDLGPESARLYARWLERGYNASMAYLEKYQDLRTNPATLLPGAQTVISTAFSYRLPPGHRRHPLIADYALGLDYHDVLRARLAPVCELITQLYPGADTRICVDTAPIHERLWALRAGIGFIGKNAMLTVDSCGAGSRVFLAEIITTAALPPDAPTPPDLDPCGECELCLIACPGHALRPGQVDARLCYSYNTIENRDPELPEGIDLHGRRLYGCDICQDVCPYNRNAYTGPYIPEFAPRPELYTLLRSPADLATLDRDTYLTLFRGSAIRRAKLPQLHRNATT